MHAKAVAGGCVPSDGLLRTFTHGPHVPVGRLDCAPERLIAGYSRTGDWHVAGAFSRYDIVGLCVGKRGLGSKRS
jgi:hypothetical protein